MTTCILTLILACGSHSASMLNLAHATIAFADTYTTQQNARNIPYWYETNPTVELFQSHGPTLAYSATASGVMITSALAYKMRHSTHKWVRSIWWVPQVALTGASVWGIHGNLQLGRQ